MEARFRQSGISTVFDRPLHKDLFLKGFFTALYYRNSCYQCKYAQSKRIGDLTLGDFWGVDKEVVKTDLEKGISLCMVNTQKGQRLFDFIKKYIGNKQLNHPMPHSLRAKYFSILYPIIGFKWAVCLSIPEIIIKNLIIGHHYSHQ